MTTPREFLEDKGLDTEQIVAYSVPNGTEPPIDMYVEELMREYTVKALHEAIAYLQEYFIPEKWGPFKIKFEKAIVGDKK